ncbi:hypothetical protein IQ247_07645 [Plectonema cf. radiosum LEGE 06105]|uniref:Uncharacterized protein n=1 Tax=Plectonema cf. radiosum LEGE 06105 TaxID=945769 RepID=A0A8J7F5T9_9CYAN|nr:hypothetical protein [Plectonema radiosum]MBE9212589.1 hypothetical protein [Plectonema cf. radiosum LEGE 06105]
MIRTRKSLNKNRGFFSKYITYSNCLILVFFILSFIGIINHEMWRDETQAWLIARDASNLTDLYENLKYEGHPGLWHLCLFLITKITRNPFAMQFFHILISTAIVYIFVKKSPFNLVQKTFFTFSYFSLFEYNLISRNYNLGILLVFIFCYLFTRININYITTFLTLALLANTNVYGLIICLCLSATLILDRIREYRINQNNITRQQIKNLLIGLLILCLGIGLSILQILPAAIQDTTNDIQQNLGETATVSKFELILNLFKRLGYTLRSIWYSYVPIPNFLEYHFWSTNITFISPYLTLVALFLSLFLLLFSVLIFIDKPIVLFLYLSGNFTIFLFTWFKWQGTLRHHGHLFFLFLACIWISRCFHPSDKIPKRWQKITNLTNFCQKYQNKAITIILTVQMFSGFYAYTMDLTYPFSRSKVAAEFIQKQGLSEEFILGSKDTTVSPISAYIDKQIFYIEYNKLGSFFNNKQRIYLENQSKLINQVDSAIKDNLKKNVLILSEPLEVTNTQLKITKIKEFRNSIIAEERYYIYLVEKNN